MTVLYTLILGSFIGSFIGFSALDRPYAACLVLNWWYYARRNAEVEC